jgi:hypothetical protein
MIGVYDSAQVKQTRRHCASFATRCGPGLCRGVSNPRGMRRRRRWRLTGYRRVRPGFVNRLAGTSRVRGRYGVVREGQPMRGLSRRSDSAHGRRTRTGPAAGRSCAVPACRSCSPNSPPRCHDEAHAAARSGIPGCAASPDPEGSSWARAWVLHQDPLRNDRQVPCRLRCVVRYQNETQNGRCGRRRVV